MNKSNCDTKATVDSRNVSFRFLPESPRWLLATGKLEEASKILETLASVNQKDLPDSFKLKLKVLY